MFEDIKLKIKGFVKRKLQQLTWSKILKTYFYFTRKLSKRIEILMTSAFYPF